jgi:hypothetical protein
MNDGDGSHRRDLTLVDAPSIDPDTTGRRPARPVASGAPGRPRLAG